MFASALIERLTSLDSNNEASSDQSLLAKFEVERQGDRGSDGDGGEEGGRKRQ